MVVTVSPSVPFDPRVQSPVVLVLAEGTGGAKANAQGHLFEAFTARLLEKYGYEPPRREHLNVTADGIELDVVTRHRLSGNEVIAECKAYTSNLPVGVVNQFYGKLSHLRLYKPTLHGWLFALPGLTADGTQLASKTQSRDNQFRVLTANDIWSAVQEMGLAPTIPPLSDPFSDPALIITEHGLFGAVKILDFNSRLPTAIRVWGQNSSTPTPVINLIAASDYAAGRPVIADSTPHAPAETTHAEPTLVEVKGSSSDFEYQFPASPPFFIGRRRFLSTFENITNKLTRGQVVVLNAQSGWGKSSLALRMREDILKRSGHALVFDARTATDPGYVWSAIRLAALEAEKKKILELPSTAAFASLRSTINTLRDIKWRDTQRPLFIFFDQFENVFRDRRLTQEFRDLALAIREIPHPILIGFAWKTDLVGWTEDHPYQLRDEIRASSEVFTVVPFGPDETGALLRRLERALGTKILTPLKQRVREYSQGLPWLFKKLASHLLRELHDGASQDSLLADALSVQRLFEHDLSELGPVEQEGLHAIARAAPILASEVLEMVAPQVVQSLLDRRLIVQVGQRLDTYWDIFRDFLNTGRVPIQESYIIRERPASVTRLLRETLAAGGDLGVQDLASRLGTSDGVIFNRARELRQMGVLTAAPGRIRIADDIRQAAKPELAVRERVSSALRRHKALSLLLRLIEDGGTSTTIAEFASILPEAFPAIQATPNTWQAYAQAFAHWFSFAGLITLRGEKLFAAIPSSAESTKRDGGITYESRRKTFPQSGPAPTLKYLVEIMRGMPSALPTSARKKAHTNLTALGVINKHGTPLTQVTKKILTDKNTFSPPGLREIIEQAPGGAAALALLKINPSAPSYEVGQAIKEAMGLPWSDGTTLSAGKYFRAWARTAGMLTKQGRPRPSKSNSQLSLIGK